MTFASLRSYMSSKIGRCPRCWRLSFRGALLGWLVIVVVLLVTMHTSFSMYRQLLIAVLAVWPASFTALWLTHAVTFSYRATKNHAKAPQTSDGSPTFSAFAMESAMTRKQLTQLFFKSAVFVLLVSMPGVALAQSSCQDGYYSCGTGKCCPQGDHCCGGGVACCASGYDLYCSGGPHDGCYPSNQLSSEDLATLRNTCTQIISC